MAWRRRRGVRRSAAGLACALLATVATGCEADVRVSGPSSSARPSGGASRPAERNVAQARDDLGALRVTSQSDGDGYSRERFGGRWKDTDRNGCDQRNDILARDLRQVRKRDDCVVTSGRLRDPYSGRDITFDRSKPAEVQIDHVYPLALAWRMGASRWSEDRRERFANDPDNLLAVWGVPNREKSDSGPAEWKPDEAFRCEYGIRYVSVARKYSLPVTRADRDALRGFLDRC
ncbi:HNH endonuclease family protein [Actinomadura sp. NPDC047616]|uniref:HNH endonuclease family protein n=1 Tax=Actinomadura sp. NPDC047616 TaxID=3155914 RepID=UPI0033EFAAFE